MTGLNLDSSGNFQTGKLFNYKINYNSPLQGLANPNPDFSIAIKPRYNGNIAEVLWQKEGDTRINRYGYVYDGLNRLLAGLYQSDLTATSKEHSERLTYDLNGNIITLKRSAFFMGTAADLIDNLEYDYTGNRLDAVHDNRGAIPNPSGYEGGGNTISYDVNGNMVDMRDKGITAISYNHLNLPKQFTINPDSNTTTLIKTIYRADGLKIRKENTTAIGGIIGDLTTVSATDYLDGFQYLKLTRLSEGGGSTGRRVEELETEVAMEREAFSPELMAIAAPPVINANQSAVLQFVPTAEGFYDFTENKYIYQYKDHLGNTRLSYAWNSTTSSIDVLDRNDYYPFGMNHLDANAGSFFGQGSYKNYKYNGKELQETGMYDYGTRFLMPDIGRFGTIDPRSQYTHEAYSYVWNNPIFFNDPTGMTGEAFAHCPTCPNTAEFKPYIDDKYNVYVYDSKTNAASLKVTDIQEVTLTRKAKSNDSGPGGLAMWGLFVSQWDSPAPGPFDVLGGMMILGAGVWWTLNQFTPPSTGYTTIADPGVGMRNLNSESDTDVNGVEVPKEGKDFDDVWNDAKDGDATKGKSTQKEKDISDWEQDSKIKLQNEKEIDTKFGKGRTGLDSNGNRVNVRPGSKGANGGNPTIERIKNGRYQKIRYK